MHALPLSAPYQLRAQRDDDAGFVAALYSSTRDDLRQMPAEPAVIEQLIAMQQRMQSHGYRQAYPHAAYLVLQRGDTPIGRLILVDIAILPAAQGQGAGSAVLRGLQAQAGAERRDIHLAVNKSNTAARAVPAVGFSFARGKRGAGTTGMERAIVPAPNRPNTWLQLPLHFDVARMQHDSDQFAAGEWISHFNKGAYDQGWSCVPLRSPGGAADHIMPVDGAAYAGTPQLRRWPALPARSTPRACWRWRRAPASARTATQARRWTMA